MLAARPRAAGRAGLPHVVVMDGVVIGGWRRTLERDEIRIRMSLVRKLTRVERAALQAAAEGYARHLGDLPVVLAGAAGA